MPDRKLVTLNELGTGREGVVVEIRGGSGIIDRLDALNLRAGKRVKKISAMVMRGPVTIDIEGKHIAMGRGMAGKVIVEIT